ncbi:MAG TPA: HEAT repeat domain-containing protein, partial [Blastocatellia bacterium]|nr:HEAT repeat domain-containing protein [Blastocatellia bacterium]
MKHLQRKYSPKTFLAFCLLVAGWQPAIAQVRQKARTPSTADQPNPIAKRVREINSLGESKNPGALAEIRRALSSSQWYERGAAALAFARIAQRDAVPDLAPLLDDENWFVRDSAIEALVVAGDPAAAIPIERLLQSPDPFTRARAATALSRLNTPTAATALVKLLQDGSSQVRRAAASALGELKIPSAADNLIALLKDEQPAVRAAAAVSLGRIGDKRAAASVEAEFEKAGDDAWRYAAALCRLGKPEYLNRLTPALKSPYRETRAEAFASLMDLADPRSLPDLVEALHGASPDQSGSAEAISLRVAFARGLVRFEGTEARDALIALTADPEPAVRASAVASLAARARFAGPADPASIKTVVGLLKREQSPVVIEAVMAALPSFDKDKLTDSLLGAIDGDAKGTARIREGLKAVDVTPEKLASSLKAGDPSTQIAALEKLERLRDPGTAQAL